ncbi:ergothioneine biosynthesis glutamate--cysteine ligase EgtA [soil metagenome]
MDGIADMDAIREVVARSLSPLCADVPVGAVGLEAEHFCMRLDRRGGPAGRVGIAELTALLDDHPGLDAEGPQADRLTGWRTADGARFLPEPGAQLEYAGTPHTSAGAALTAMHDATADLATFLDTRGVALVSAGLDPWHPAESVAQSLSCPRYPAMSTYLARRTPHGHTMMTGTASLQVNLDLGGTHQVAERWATALLVAPLATATFASSPVPGAVNGRAVVWQWLDTTRTGIPPAFTGGVDDPVEVLTRMALDADVLLFRDARAGTVHPGEPGFTMRRWLADGHPLHGHPSADDIAYHLTTLFPEVRLRGFLEIRSIDALPQRWRAVPIVLYAGLLYDTRAREYVRGLMEAHRAALPDLLRRAAHVGVADPQLCALAVEVWTTAAEGARRLPPGYVDPAELARAERFLDTFTLRGRAPSDELRGRLAEGSEVAMRWAREPVGQLTHC